MTRGNINTIFGKSSNFLSFVLPGVEAKRVFDEAQALLRNILDKKEFRAVAQLAFYPANSVEDDIQLYHPDGGDSEILAVFHGLRQQAEKEPGVEDPYACLSDFVAPKESGLTDYIGCFACSCFGAEKLVER